MPRTNSPPNYLTLDYNIQLHTQGQVVQSDLKTDYAMDIFVVPVFVRWLLMVFCFRFFFRREKFMVQSKDGCSLVVRKQYNFVKTIFVAIKLSTRCAVLHRSEWSPM